MTATTSENAGRDDAPVRHALHRLLAGHPLTEDEMAAALGAIMDGQAHDAQVGALLTALRLRGETPEEILGAVRAMRARAVPVDVRTGGRPLLDTAGTGGDGQGTFNISTAVAFVCAAGGVAVAKHGNRAVSSRVGSADVLEALGVRLTLAPEAVARCVEEVGVGFLFAPAHHAALRHAAPARRALGFRTLLNLLGPMTNPAGATHQLVGLFDASRLEVVAQVLGRLGAERALVVHGRDGMDELSTAAPTDAVEWHAGATRRHVFHPDALGLSPPDPGALAGGDAARNAAILRDILGGAAGPGADVVALNAGAALWIAGRADDLPDGLTLARELLASGEPLRRVQALAALSQELAP